MFDKFLDKISFKKCFNNFSMFCNFNFYVYRKFWIISHFMKSFDKFL